MSSESVPTMTAGQALAHLAVYTHSFTLTTDNHRTVAETPSEYVREALGYGTQVVGEINDDAPLFELFVYPSEDAVGAYAFGFIGSELLPLLRTAVAGVIASVSCGIRQPSLPFDIRVRQDAPDPDRNPSIMEVVLAVELVDGFDGMGPGEQSTLVDILVAELMQQDAPLSDDQIANAVARVTEASTAVQLLEAKAAGLEAAADADERPHLAAAAYAAYTASAGGLNYRGEKCPEWADLPKAIQGHWGAAVAVTVPAGHSWVKVGETQFTVHYAVALDESELLD